MTSGANQILIDLRNVTKSYQTEAGTVTVLDDVTAQIRAGEFVCVVGPSGSGKSTLLNMITGIDKPTSGEVFVDNQAVHTMAQDALAQWRGKHIGVVFQFFQLLPNLTILENVVLPMDFCHVYARRERLPRALALLDLVGISKHAYKLPGALSGGEQQRAAIARALANDPPLLVADEPTGNLDSKTAAGLMELLYTLHAQGKTLLIVTHDLGLSEKAERVIHLRDGRIAKITVPGQPAASEVGKLSS